MNHSPANDPPAGPGAGSPSASGGGEGSWQQRLEEARRAALNMMEDALAAKQQAEEAVRLRDREIEERRRAEERIAEELDFNHHLLTNSFLGVLVYSEAGDCRYANPAAAEIVGARVDQLLAQNFRQLPSWEQSGLLAAAEDTLSTGQERRAVFHVTTSFGTEVWMEGRFSLFRRGGERNLLLTFLDLSDLKRKEAQLVLQEKALQSAANAIVITRRDGTIEWVNDAFTRLTGYTREEALGQNPRLLKSGHQNDAFYSSLWQTITEGEVWQGEIKNKRKDGAVYTEQMSVAPVRDASGQITHFVAIKQDISERKLMEQQFLRAQRMESIGMLAGGIAHDLNNVLAPIMMSIELLKMTHGDKETRDLLETIQKSAQRGADIVRQVLTFARGVHGERVLLNPRHVVKDMVRVAREAFPRNINVETAFDPFLWTITGDPTQLHQVLLNLCVNARDAMPDGGTLQLRAFNYQAGPHETGQGELPHPGPYVCLTVKDSGTGMPPEVIEHLFEPFFTTKEQGKGTGLGLSTALGIVRSHQGFLRVQSQPGRGTEFQVYLPATTDAHLPDEQGEGAVVIPPGAGELILLVDDEPSIRDIAREALLRHGYRVLTAGDGTEALAVVAQHSAELKLVITDIMMPFLDGVGLIRSLRRLAPGLKVIACSGLASGTSPGGRLDELKRLGIPGVLHKPFTTHTLLLAVHRLLQGESLDQILGADSEIL